MVWGLRNISAPIRSFVPQENNWLFTTGMILVGTTICRPAGKTSNLPRRTT